ncbi:hypothetical protein [Candidatus Contubernalis alkaliaceticus]|uniref:hypothetical protein n=1 Tax=Candidatus Contubernalis alkaliaceticus TaxID=338645 RepID=UPI001F4C09E4|nr:hypothetical protein [Candidatus Contubernalis alkalaceticus]UNC92723.1 hypothetical protein HUE98_11820 [Candidatus Contubernalis alkalaceticus]
MLYQAVVWELKIKTIEDWAVIGDIGDKDLHVDYYYNSKDKVKELWFSVDDEIIKKINEKEVHGLKLSFELTTKEFDENEEPRILVRYHLRICQKVENKIYALNPMHTVTITREPINN